MNTRTPVLFVGHGNPMNAIEHNTFHRCWQDLGRQLPTPRAILCISAHWETRGVYLTASENPETIHDFYGFPKALFDVQYPAPGNPDLARHIMERIRSVNADLDMTRGLDHGAWSVLIAMFPEADIPVIQLSLDTGQPGIFHYTLAKELACLRDEGVLILGSGNIVHNLRLFDFHQQEPLDWAADFNETVKERIRTREHAALIDYDQLGQNAKLAIPTPEHYLPLLYALALQDEEERVDLFNDTVISALSMTSILIGG